MALFFCGIIAAARPAAGPSVSVKATLDKKAALIGEALTYKIIVNSPVDFEIDFGSFEAGDKKDGLLIQDSETTSSSFFGKKNTVKKYVLRFYSSGGFNLPQQIVRYKEKNSNDWKQIKTDILPVKIDSLLSRQPDASDIRDIKGPVTGKNYFWILAIFCAAIAIVLFLLLKARKTGRKIEAFVKRRPAHEVAYEALERLKNKGLPAAAKIKEYYIELSGILRRYLEDRFNFRAPEMTTEEFLNTARDSRVLSGSHRALLKEFLVHCDMVKFAKYTPSDNEASLSFESAKRFVDETKEIDDKGHNA